jgi:hypothetical protein
VLDAGGWQPPCDETAHPFPVQPGALTTAPQRLEPHPSYLDTKGLYRISVTRHGIVDQVALDHTSKPLALHRDELMPTPLKLVVDLFKLSPHPFTDRDAPQPKPSTPGNPAHVRETKKIKRFQLPQTPRFTSPGDKAPELNQPSLIRMKFQSELREPLPKINPKPLRIFKILETSSEIISEPNNDHVTFSELFPPPLSPHVEYVVQVHISEQR